MQTKAAPPPPVVYRAVSSQSAAGQGNVLGSALGGGAAEDPELAAAIAASMLPDGPSAKGSSGVETATPVQTESEDDEWDEAPPDATGAPGAVVLRVRLPGNNAQFQRGFLPEATLHQVLCAVHHHSGLNLSSRKTYQLTTMGSPPVTNTLATLASMGYGGRMMVNLSECAA